MRGHTLMTSPVKCTVTDLPWHNIYEHRENSLDFDTKNDFSDHLQRRTESG